MQTIFYQFGKNIVNSFTGKNKYIHLIAIGLTSIIVIYGFDGWYFSATRSPVLQSYIFPATFIGGTLPILIPLTLLLIGKIKENKKFLITGYAIAQAAIVGLLISSTYKAFTGRAHPSIHRSGIFDNLPVDPNISVDTLSKVFHFGVLNGGVFWGWPSSHTTIAFAVALTIWVLYQKNTFIKYLAIFIAAYVGIGVSTNIHWFSDFVAGTLIGSAIGIQVGRSFLKKLS